MSEGLPERLRERADEYDAPYWTPVEPSLLREAADAIEALEKEHKRLLDLLAERGQISRRDHAHFVNINDHDSARWMDGAADACASVLEDFGHGVIPMALSREDDHG